MLTAAAAAGKGFLRLVNTDLGYDPHNAMSVPIPVHENTHVAWKDRAEFFEQIRARIAAMPEVVAAGISTNATPPSNGWRQNIEILGSTATEKPEVRVNFVSPEYFSLLRIPLGQRNAQQRKIFWADEIDSHVRLFCRRSSQAFDVLPPPTTR